MKYSQAKLKVLRNEMLQDEDKRPIEWAIVYRDIVNFDTYHPENNEREQIDWRDTIWRFAIGRSLEIWKELNNEKIASSLGELSKFTKRSLPGKLSSSKDKFNKKLANGNWQFMSMKQTPYHKEFKPFSNTAIESCKKRARANK
jgi:hypothetical protein